MIMTCLATRTGNWIVYVAFVMGCFFGPCLLLEGATLVGRFAVQLFIEQLLT